jgi:hypothetical protein
LLLRRLHFEVLRMQPTYTAYNSTAHTE